MKRRRLVLFLGLVLAASGCGKSDDHRRKEAAINSDVMALRRDIDSRLSTFAALQSQLKVTLKEHERLAKRYPRKMAGHASEDLTAAAERLDSMAPEVERTISALPKYSNEMDHTEAMTLLDLNKVRLAEIRSKVIAAEDAADSAIINHQKFQATLSPKPSVKAGGTSMRKSK